MPNRVNWRTQAYKPVDNFSKVFAKAAFIMHSSAYICLNTLVSYFFPPFWGLCKCLSFTMATDALGNE